MLSSIVSDDCYHCDGGFLSKSGLIQLIHCLDINKEADRAKKTPQVYPSAGLLVPKSKIESATACEQRCPVNLGFRKLPVSIV